MSQRHRNDTKTLEKSRGMERGFGSQSSSSLEGEIILLKRELKRFTADIDEAVIKINRKTRELKNGEKHVKN